MSKFLSPSLILEKKDAAIKYLFKTIRGRNSIIIKGADKKLGVVVF